MRLSSYERSTVFRRLTPSSPTSARNDAEASRCAREAGAFASCAVGTTRKWTNGFRRRHNLPYTPISERTDWQLPARFASQFGAENLEDGTPLTAYDAAKAIGIEPYYDTHYRGFSHYTHGLLEAISGALDQLIDPEASRVMLQSAMTALDAITYLGANCPNLESLSQRAPLTKIPDKLLRRKSEEA